MTWDWASFALGALACVLGQVIWAACYTSGYVLRALRKGHIADLLGTAIMWALVLAAVVAAVWAMNEALLMMAMSIRRGV
jgi:hypothetical protein